MGFTESLANPGTQIADVQAIGEWCKEKNLVYVVDNTLVTPLLCTGKSMGASLVVNSLSKHIGGHGNALGGTVTDTGLYDWSDYGNIAESYRKGKPTSWGLTQHKKTGMRDMVGKPDRTRVVGGTGGAVRVDQGGRRVMKKKNT